jgi:uncharacterized spore protein YtfJ
MTSTSAGNSPATILDSIRGTRDALSTRRVFGEPQEVSGVTVIPVARVAGGAGGGGGEGNREDETGSGFGTGFGMHASPIGAYAIRDGDVQWKPAVDVTRLIRGCQVLAGIVSICLTFVTMRRLRLAGGGRS